MSKPGFRDVSREVLCAGGILNPGRVVRLIAETISLLKLDLTGLTVLTEAASGPFVVTPVIAAMAGAERVIALTGDSRFGSGDSVIAQTHAMAALCSVPSRIEVYNHRNVEFFACADIITNLGFVRPLNQEAVSAMKSDAVISLMCEAWELRPKDIDLDVCRKHKIAVLATNEDFPSLDVFGNIGWLCTQLLIDAQIELHNSKLVIVSSDKFGRFIERFLARSGVQAILVSHLDLHIVNGMDAVVIADYTRYEEIIGNAGDVTPADLARAAPDVTVVQLAGRVDTEALKRHGLTIYPGVDLESRRMVRTLAALGPRPVVELHAAGLKVGEIAHRARRTGGVVEDRYAALIQVVV